MATVKTTRLFSLTAVVLLAGCGPKDGLERAQISGIITIQGEPLSHASVQFVPAGAPGLGALGFSDENGKFTVISSREDDAGVPPGDYMVVVSRWANPDGKVLGPEDTQADNQYARETIPAPYSGQSSPLKVNIPKEGGEIKIDVPAKLMEFRKGARS